MPGRLTRWICRGGLVLLGCLLVLSVLGGALPELDRINHGQALISLAALVLLVLAWAGRASEELPWCGCLALLNLMVFAAPVVGVPSLSSAAPSGDRITVMTFNAFYWQQQPASVVAYIESELPDVVVLQEISGERANWLNRELTALYPYRRFCNRCDIALLSRRPWGRIREWARDQHAVPPMIVATFPLPGGGEYTVAGVHLMNPRQPRRQQREIGTLVRELATRPGPMIVAGDMNLTPWSWELNRFQAALGLRRHTGLLGTWSTSRVHLLPWFPIDHVLTTPDFGLISVQRGPKLGSDHLPVIATLSLPRSKSH